MHEIKDAFPIFLSEPNFEIFSKTNNLQIFIDIVTNKIENPFILIMKNTNAENA